MKRIAWLLWVWVLAGCTKPEHREAAAFRDKLAEEIRDASFIEVVEHSYMSDFPEHVFPNYPEMEEGDVPEIEYARVRLSEDQKGQLLEMVKGLDETDPSVPSFCYFVPHHTMEFHSASGVSSRLEICFHCGDLKWDDANREVPPETWMTAFAGFIEGIGMHPQADWKDLVLKSGKVPVGR